MAAVTWRVFNLRQQVDEPDSAVIGRGLEVIGVDPDRVRAARIARRSIDARRRRGKQRVEFVVHVDVVFDAEMQGPALDRAERTGRARRVPAPGRFEVDGGAVHGAAPRVAVVGSGPAGLFAAMVLARNGWRVTILERGSALEDRGRAVTRFVRERDLDPESNLLFGEGGAGTYSDGKIYTRVDHPLEVPILAELVACGAPAEIQFDSRAHIGTDRLHRVLPALRSRLERLGVEFCWNTRLDDLRSTDEGGTGRVTQLETSAGAMEFDVVMLALGHSARDTLAMLHRRGVALESKPFQLGVRIEHPQHLIDRGRYGDGPLAAQLGAAYYGLSCPATAELPEVHSFCMCPGGQIVASVNIPELLCTNGMSNSRHSSPWASAALVTTVTESDFGTGPFAGVELQTTLEHEFFAAGGGDYTAPAQHAPDFLGSRSSPSVARSSYKLGVCPGRIDSLLPPRIRAALSRALEKFDRQIPGFAGSEALIVGLESRSSAPVRLPRDPESGLAVGFSNLLPVGEGAGYAGGIMSAAIDGARSAQALVRQGLK